jgi:hypothetical protein
VVDTKGGGATFRIEVPSAVITAEGAAAPDQVRDLTQGYGEE